MSFSHASDPAIILRDRNQRLGLRLDPQTGLLDALLMRQGESEVSLPLAVSAELVTEGQEAARAPSGLGYVNTEQLSTFRRVNAAPLYSLEGPQETYTVPTEVGAWAVLWHYTFRQSHPRLEIRLDVSPTTTPATPAATLRDVHLAFDFHPADLAAWRVEAPGNQIRPGVEASALLSPVRVSPVGGVAGSPGIIALHHPDQQQVIVLWPFSRTEIGATRLQTHADTLQLFIDTGLAGRLSPGEVLAYGAIEMDALDSTWEETRDQIADWYTTLGLSTPCDRPQWITGASIFEVQIGASVFWQHYRYEPYPTVRDLLADLGRIKGLGYTLLQIMPRQPYPSYNVHDYTDITTSYGNQEDLRTLVQACHALDIRVILDIILHGVIDQEVMAQTAQRVRSGPYFARLTEHTTHTFSADEQLAISWSRHILDFEPYWSAGSPARHPLVDEHPEWFLRDSAQNIIGIYTKAFDVANLGWQEYFSTATEYLVQKLDIDGFRFDAPTYNDLPNWSTATERRASYSPLGSLELFRQLRPRLKKIKDSLLFYTEPSGVLFQQAMDVTYNYDEQWLIHAVLQPTADEWSQGILVRNGRELAAWFRDRNALLPAGSLIAHHIDSHDTFWWPLPGHKWRREQYGLAAARALLAVFALSGGVYMTFVGGEEGLEDDVRRAHRLRATLSEVGHGVADYTAVTVDHDTLYAVVRKLGSTCSVVLVNLSDQPSETTCTLDCTQLHLQDMDYGVYDAWNEQALDMGMRSAVPGAEMWVMHLAFDAFQPRLLVLRPAAMR